MISKHSCTCTCTDAAYMHPESHFTRTWIVGGETQPVEIRIYEILNQQKSYLDRQHLILPVEKTFCGNAVIVNNIFSLLSNMSSLQTAKRPDLKLSEQPGCKRRGDSRLHYIFLLG